MWDLRSDNAALIHRHGVHLAGVVDLQLHHLAWRVSNRLSSHSLIGLGTVLAETDHAGLDPDERRELATLRSFARSHFAPEAGGDGRVWRERPLHQVLVRYCTDARLFFRLRDTYKLYESNHWPALRAATERRLKESAEKDFGSDKRRAVDEELIAALQGQRDNQSSSAHPL